MRQCGQLREADAAGDGAGFGGFGAMPGWVLGAGAVLVAGAMLADRARGDGGMGARQSLGGGGGSGGVSADEAAVRAQRARFLDSLGAPAAGGSSDLAESLRQRQAAS